MKDLIIQIIKLKIQYISLIIKYMQEQTEAGKKIYTIASQLLGTDVTPQDKISDVYACAEVVNELVRRATGKSIGGGASTYQMYAHLHNENRFLKVMSSLPGDIIISPTGHGNGLLPNGHVGIIGKFGILSNNSENGKLEEKLTLETWKKIYMDVGGFPMDYFRVL